MKAFAALAEGLIVGGATLVAGAPLWVGIIVIYAVYATVAIADRNARY